MTVAERRAMRMCPPLLQYNREVWFELVWAVLDAAAHGDRVQWTPETGDPA